MNSRSLLRAFLSVLILCLASLASRGAPAKEPAQTPSTPAPLHRIDAKTPAGLQDLFRRTGEPLPLVSAHRGGPQTGFPENCIATFENTLRHTYAILEIDPRLTKDGQIVVHHDATLERTTTGRGRVADHTLAELKELRLKDPAGNVTEHQIPTLDEVLEWARGKTILVLDQKDVSVAARVKKIEEHQAEAYAMLIVYSFKDVQACYELNPNVMMEVMIPSRAKLGEFQKLGVPWQNIVAFVGHEPPEDAALYEAIHAEGTCCMIGTSRNLDRKIITGETTDIQQLKPAYRAFMDRGADIVETDIPTHLGPLLYKEAALPAAKKHYFSVVAGGADAEPDPRGKLETAIPYFIKLLEEEQLDLFLDKAMHPITRARGIDLHGRDGAVAAIRQNRAAVIDLLQKAQKLKGEPFKPYAKADEEGIQFRVPIGESGEVNVLNFRKREGVWYGQF